MADKPVVKVGPMEIGSGNKVDKKLAKSALKDMQDGAVKGFKSKFSPTDKTKDKNAFGYQAKLVECSNSGDQVTVVIDGQGYPLEKMKPVFLGKGTKATVPAGKKPEQAVADAVYAAAESNAAKVGKAMLSYKP